MPRKSVFGCDNLSAKALASNPMIDARSKHIEIDVHYIRDQVLQNQVTIASHSRSNCRLFNQTSHTQGSTS